MPFSIIYRYYGTVLQYTQSRIYGLKFEISFYLSALSLFSGSGS